MLTDEQIKEREFTEDQIELVNSVYAEKEADLLALANKNADGIFNGAAEKLSSYTGIKKGDKEKYSDYFERLGNEWLPSAAEQRVLDAERKANEKVVELEAKIKNHKGDESLKIELQEAKDKLSKIPDLLKAKEDEWSEKYSNLETEYKTTKQNRAFEDSMPKFDDNVNQFELRAKKTNAIDRIKKAGYELGFDEIDNFVASKDYQTSLVSELLKNDEELKDLVLIEQSTGGGGHGAERKTKSLNIPDGVSKSAAQEVIRQFMKTVESIDKLDPKYTDRFKELCKENNVL